jgi:hypothetical protein
MAPRGESICPLRSIEHFHYTRVPMRYHAVASFIPVGLLPAALLAAIIPAFPITAAFAQGGAPAGTVPPPVVQANPATPPAAVGGLPAGTSGTQPAGTGPAASQGSAGAAVAAPVAAGAGVSQGGAGAAVAAPVAAGAGVSTASAAGDDAGGAPVAPPAPHRMVASLSHDLQFGLALMFGGGYRGIFPYETMIVCGDAKADDNRVCTNRAPTFIDVEPSFGIAQAWDFMVDLRFGVEKDFNTYRQFFVMPGFRYWLDPQSQVKFFTTIQLAYDRSKQNSLQVGNSDLGFRNSNGLMVEVMRNFGVYAQFGETIGFYRWLSFMVDAGIGIQARVP